MSMLFYIKTIQSFPSGTRLWGAWRDPVGVAKILKELDLLIPARRSGRDGEISLFWRFDVEEAGGLPAGYEAIPHDRFLNGLIEKLLNT